MQDCLSYYNEAFARKLSIDHILDGHEGCVNRVCWSQDGTFLASGSDDRKVCPGHVDVRSLTWERLVGQL